MRSTCRVLSRWLGRRRGWLVFSQILLMAAIVFLGLCDPAAAPWLVAVGALLVATASATQDIVIDAFRVESLDESEQAAGMASYVAAYRIGMLVSTAGALFLVSGFEASGLGRHGAWSAGYAVMAVLVLVGMATTLIATEPDESAQADSRPCRREAAEARHRGRGRRVLGFPYARYGAGGARLRHPVQVHRRAGRRDDGAVRHRSRVFTATNTPRSSRASASPPP